MTPSHPTKVRTDLNPARILTFKINDIDVTGREDETILKVAQQKNIYIPTLCHLEGLSERGACRLCIIEVKGSRSCYPPASPIAGKVWRLVTDSERVVNFRKKDS